MTPAPKNLAKPATLMTRRSALAWTGTLWVPQVGAQAYFDAYGLSPRSSATDVGVQPLGIPSGVLSAVMARDRLLRKALSQMSAPLQTYPFQRGADMVTLLGQQRLEAGLLGDMPTLLAASAGQVYVAGLVKQTSTAIVAKNVSQVSGLKGRRVAYTELSSAHHTLLQGLASAQMTETDVKLVPMRIDEMPSALEKGDIDAFAAWEPAPSVALSRIDGGRIVFRGQSADYFVVEKEFAKHKPEAALLLVSALVRAVEWLQRSTRNLEKAVAWTLADGQAFAGKPSGVSVAQGVAITRREILDVPSAPVVPIYEDRFPLQAEFQFLARLGKLPAGARWEHVKEAFSYDGINRVFGQASRYQTTVFDYGD